MPRSTTKPESANVPAYQRKRSLSAKARARMKPRTALERREAGIAVVKPKRTRRTVRAGTSVGTLFGSSSSSNASSSFGNSSGASLADPDYRAKIAARRAALSGLSTGSGPSVAERRAALVKARLSSAGEREAKSLREGKRGEHSSLSSGGGFASLSTTADRITGKNKYGSSSDSGFSAPMVDDSYGSDYGSSPSYVSEGSESSDFREMRECGSIVDFFEQIDVVAMSVNSRIAVGDRLIFETMDGLFEQALDSMQVDRKDVEVAYSGDDVGIKVKGKPRKGGRIYKVV